MSPQDKVERVLKEIHVAFSKSETYNGHPDRHGRAEAMRSGLFVKKGMKLLRRPMQTRRMCMLHLSFIRQI